MNEKEQLQLQISEAIHQDLVKIVSLYSSINKINLDDIILLVQKVNLLDVHDVKYIHNNELDEIIEIMYQELKEDNSPPSLAFLTILDFIKNKVDDFRRFLYVNLCLRTDINHMTESISIFSSISQSVKKLFEDYLNYIFNETFFTLEEQIQIELILKIWGFSREIFHDNEASKYAYEKLLKVFNLAIEKEQTEVAFWLYYTPLHYFNSGTGENINELNEKFKIEVEKPLEKFILNKIVPKYNIMPNDKKINKNGKIKVAFVMQRILNHSTVNVFYSLLKKLLEKDDNQYEFILYDLAFAESGGSQEDLVEKFKKLGVKYKNLHMEIFDNMSPFYPLLEKMLKTRDILISDDIDILIGLHTRVEYMFFYATRTAPKQIYWYHASNAQYDIEGIDKRISHGKNKCEEVIINKFKVNTFYLDGVKDINKYDKNELFKLKEEWKSKIVLGVIGRLVKLESKRYLRLIIGVMKKNKNIVFFICGAGDSEKIKKIILEIDKTMLDRFIFWGYVNSSLFGKVIDIWPDTFPLTQGESKNEFALNGNFILTLHESKEVSDLYKSNYDLLNSVMSEFKYDKIFPPVSDWEYEYILVKLIENKDFRLKMGQIYKEIILNQSKQFDTRKCFLNAIN